MPISRIRVFERRVFVALAPEDIHRRGQRAFFVEFLGASHLFIA